MIKNQTKPEHVGLETDLSRNNLGSAMAKRALNSLKNDVLGPAVGNYTKSYETWRRV